MKLKISSSLSLPLDWMSLATVVYGARGSGKTTFGSVVAEEVTKAGQRFCAIDLKGDWYGLKSTADGKGKGIPTIVFGGDHADVPLEEGAGKFLGETVAGLSQSCILDLEQLSKGKQIRFLAEFFETLYHANRDPLLLLMDESQRYAPQKPGPDEARCLGAVQDTVKLGRKHGLGVVVFTQRGAGLSKEVSELCDMLVAFRTPGPLDQDRIKDWLDANTTKAQRDEIMGKLAGLATGTAIFASGHPDLKLFGEYQVRRRETFDSSATPKVGQRRIEPKVLAKPELVELRTKMAATIERQKADDPKELRKRIGELERELKAKPAAVAQAKEKRVQIKVPFLPPKHLARLEKLGKSIERVSVRTDESGLAMARMTGDLKRVTEDLLNIAAKNVLKAAAPTAATQNGVDGGTRPKAFLSAPKPYLPRPETQSAVPEADRGMVGTGELAVLRCVAQYPDGATREQITILTGYKRSTRDAYIQRLKQRGFVNEGGAGIIGTAEGVAFLGPDFEALPTGKKLRDHWRQRLPLGERKVFEVLLDKYPNAVSRDEIGELTEFKRSTRDAYIQRLATRRLVNPIGRGEVKAAKDLFE